MLNKTETASFKIPAGHPQAGTKLDYSFAFTECESEAEATEIATAKGWNLLTLVNDNLKAAAKSAAYQAAVLPYKPSKVSADDIKERMIRDYIRIGYSAEKARKKVEETLAELDADTTE